LTKTPLNKIPEEIEMHVSGKRFKLRLKEREEAAAKGEVEDALLAGKRAEVCIRLLLVLGQASASSYYVMRLGDAT
jgi:Surfeit locus protein 2 (SURF2)